LTGTPSERPSQEAGEDPGTDSRPHVAALVGPTGVGKTAVADELALRLDGEIISADSMQIYRGMDIGTAKLDAAGRRVPHHCIDIVDPGMPFSAALYQKRARGAIERVAARGALPLVVGGTGLYVRAALDEMHFPPGDRAQNPLRERYEAIAREQGPGAVHAMLEQRDAESAALIHPQNARRTIRALELAELGLSYAQQAAGFGARRSYYPTTYVGLSMDRERLYLRIDKRVDAMLAAGLLEEVEGLLDRGLRDALTANAAIGYKELVPVLEDKADLDEAVEAIKQASRRYAKRQLTWFRADPRITWVDVTDVDVADTADAVRLLVESSMRGAHTDARTDGPGS
jgi:tRNA dimethylallyltransferase